MTDWFEAAGSQRISAAASVLSNGVATATASADVTITENDLSTLDSGFFDSAAYIGAVSDQDTSSNWYSWVETAVAAAEQD
jgi:hypothetical protein